MRGLCRSAIALGAGLLLCCTPRMQSGVPSLPTSEEIRISHGPCFGFCPVFTLAVTPAGRVDFLGERHTAVLGPRAHSVGRAVYRQVRRALAPFRPPTGQVREVHCRARATDMSRVTIEWISAGGKRTALTYRMGCRDGDTARIERIVERQMRVLDADAWAAPMRWPGAPMP